VIHVTLKLRLKYWMKQRDFIHVSVKILIWLYKMEVTNVYNAQQTADSVLQTIFVLFVIAHTYYKADNVWKSAQKDSHWQTGKVLTPQLKINILKLMMRSTKMSNLIQQRLHRRSKEKKNLSQEFVTHVSDKKVVKNVKVVQLSGSLTNKGNVKDNVTNW